MLEISPELAERIRRHGVQTYPHECCGALLGTEGDAVRHVRDLVPLVNRRDDSPRNRFSISPDDFRAAEAAARGRGLELIGWYHSHPDHPPLPSEYDRAHAWPWYSYLIVSVAGGEARGEAKAVVEAKQMLSWRLTDDRLRFAPEEIAVKARAA